MDDHGTSAPHQELPDIVPAPRVTDDSWVTDDRDGAAKDQTYPEIVPAERAAERVCPTCKRPL